MTLNVVIDSSVAVKWFFAEEGSDLAEAVVASGASLVAPTLVLAEIGNVVWKRYRQSRLDRATAEDIIRETPRFFREIVPIDHLMKRALDMALQHDHPIYDCIYVALAESRRAALLTADARLLTRFGAASSGHVLVPLDKWTTIA